MYRQKDKNLWRDSMRRSDGCYCIEGGGGSEGVREGGSEGVREGVREGGGEGGRECAWAYLLYKLFVEPAVKVLAVEEDIGYKHKVPAAASRSSQ